METTDSIRASLHESWGYLTRALDGLTPEEISWVPAAHSNSIGFIVWHMTMAEDGWVNGVIGGGSTVYETGGWQEKLGTPKESGYGYTVEQLRAWPTPKLDDLRDYVQAVRDKTLAVVDATTAERLAEATQPDRPKQTVGWVLTHVATEVAMHVGQVDYLRGIQRGLNSASR